MPAAVQPVRTARRAVGDVIVRWDGKDVKTANDLFSFVGLTEIGRRVEVVVFRDGKEIDLAVTVAARVEPTR